MNEIDELRQVQIERDRLLKAAKDICLNTDRKVEHLLNTFFQAFNRQRVDEFDVKMFHLTKDNKVHKLISHARDEILDKYNIDYDFPWYFEGVTSWQVLNHELIIDYSGGFPHESNNDEYSITFDLSASSIDQLVAKFENAKRDWNEFEIAFAKSMKEKIKKTSKETVKDLKSKIKSLELKLEEVENNRGNY
jgi:rubrerythrin